MRDAAIRRTGHLFMFVITLIFGLNIPILKYLLPHWVTPESIIVLRILFATAGFWIASLFFPKEKIAKKDWGWIFLGALTGVAVNQGIFVAGLNHTSPIDASIILTMGPLFAMIFAAILLKEPITLMKIGGIIVGGSGAIMLVYSGAHHTPGKHGTLEGNLLILASAMIYAFYLVSTKPLSLRYSSITLMKWMFLLGAIMVTPIYYKSLPESGIFNQYELTPVLALFYALFIGTFIVYMLIPEAQKRLRPTTISIYNNFQPLVAAAAAIAVGMDHLSIEKIISALLIFAGVYFVTKSKARADQPSEDVKPETKTQKDS